MSLPVVDQLGDPMINWYTGTDTESILSNQYDWQTVVLHELGHAIGMDHSMIQESVMFGTLASGVTKRLFDPDSISTLNVMISGPP